MTRAHLDRAVLEWIAEGALAPPDDERFERLALQLFAYQHAENEAYRRYCTALGVDPESVTTFEAIPAIPTGAFKEARFIGTLLSKWNEAKNSKCAFPQYRKAQKNKPSYQPA